MNKETINLPRLINLIAEGASVNPATARRFLHDLFAYIEERLAEGESVVIKGVGEFVRGEDASNPVLFKADEELAAFANEPFSAFSAVPLNDEAVDEITALDKSVEQEVSVPAAESVEITEEKPQAVEAEEIMPIETGVKEFENDSEPAPVVQMVEPAGEVVTTIEQDDETSISGTAEQTEAEPQVDERNHEDVVENPATASVEEVETAANEATEPVAEDVSHFAAEHIHDHHKSRYKEDEYEPVRYQESQGSHTLWLVLGVLIGLILGLVGGYFAGKTMAAYELPEEDDYALIDELDTDTTSLLSTLSAVDTIVTSKPAVAQETSVQEHTAKPEPAAEPVQAAQPKKSEPVYDTITSKRYLSILAKDHYGEKKYWIFIYNANPQLGNPNQISPGTKVLIPAKESFEEATKEATDAKAQRLLNQLAKKYKF